jgi:3',5'-cyclic AMP phosphodiesterase CpdA
VRVRDGVALFNLCSAVPTAPHLATGRLGQAQLDRLDALLGDLAYRDAFRVLLIHHPPIAGAVSKRKSLEDQDALRAILARHGADLILHGHAHDAMVATAPGPNGAMIPVLGVPSASAMGERGHPAARWHGVEIDRQADGAIEVRVVARGVDPKSGQAAELSRYILVQAGRPAAQRP